MWPAFLRFWRNVATFTSKFGTMESLEEQEQGRMPEDLVVFLWSGIGLGAVISLVLCLYYIITEGYGWLFSLITLADVAMLMVVAILTISAFYKRKSNAVALTKTYIAMMALSGVVSTILIFVTDDYSQIEQAVGLLVWSYGCHKSMRKSEMIEQVIPTQSRTWNWPEKLFMVVYVVILSLYTLFVAYTNLSENPRNIIYSDRRYADRLIEVFCSDLPIAIDSSLMLQNVTTEQDTVVFTYQYSGYYISDFSYDYCTDNEMVEKHETLSYLSVKPDFDPAAKICFEGGYNVAYRYIDAASETMYTVTITADEYKEVTSAGGYKCPVSDIAKLVDKYNLSMPQPYMDDATLMRIYLTDDSTEVVYQLLLPELTTAEFSKMTQSYLNEYVVSNWSELEDSIIRLAIVNQMTISFQFTTYSGQECVEVCITPDIYNSLETY